MINIILCGGSGTRLWPISRKNFPKQFCRIIGKSSLFQETVKRNINKCSSRLIIANKENVFMAMDQIGDLESDSLVPASVKYLLEPVGRNTAPAVALGCFDLDMDDIVLVTPSDHMIRDMKKYEEALTIAENAAKEGYLVTFGITPTRVETGYGYMEVAITDNKIKDAISFKEKPDASTAKQYVDAGNYYWNSGMFCFKVSTFLDELKKYSPDIYNMSQSALDSSVVDDNVCCIKMDDMLAIPENSIDYAVMENSSKVKVVVSDFLWNDIGSYDALEAEIDEQEPDKSVLERRISINSENNMIFSDRVTATVDVNDLIIVDTKDALLILKKGSSQKVKDVVAILEQRGIRNNKLKQITEIHTTVHRPWGHYTVLEEWPSFKMKRIVVQPGKRLSLQKHFHRSEHWVVVSGSAVVTKGNEEVFVKPNESIYIPVGTTHRIENPGKIDLIFLEVQVGEYLEEDDIVRIQDDFARET